MVLNSLFPLPFSVGCLTSLKGFGLEDRVEEVSPRKNGHCTDSGRFYILQGQRRAMNKDRVGQKLVFLSIFLLSAVVLLTIYDGHPTFVGQASEPEEAIPEEPSLGLPDTFVLLYMPFVDDQVVLIGTGFNDSFKMVVGGRRYDLVHAGPNLFYVNLDQSITEDTRAFIIQETEEEEKSMEKEGPGMLPTIDLTLYGLNSEFSCSSLNSMRQKMYDAVSGNLITTIERFRAEAGEEAKLGLIERITLYFAMQTWRNSWEMDHPWSNDEKVILSEIRNPCPNEATIRGSRRPTAWGTPRIAPKNVGNAMGIFLNAVEENIGFRPTEITTQFTIKRLGNDRCTIEDASMRFVGKRCLDPEYPRMPPIPIVDLSAETTRIGDARFQLDARANYDGWDSCLKDLGPDQGEKYYRNKHITFSTDTSSGLTGSSWFLYRYSTSCELDQAFSSSLSVNPQEISGQLDIDYEERSFPEQCNGVPPGPAFYYSPYKTEEQLTFSGEFNSIEAARQAGEGISQREDVRKLLLDFARWLDPEPLIQLLGEIEYSNQEGHCKSTTEYSRVFEDQRYRQEFEQNQIDANPNAIIADAHYAGPCELQRFRDSATMVPMQIWQVTTREGNDMLCILRIPAEAFQLYDEIDEIPR